MAKTSVGTDPPAEIEKEIESTRAELGSTLDALAHRLAPNRLAKQGTDMIAQFVGRDSDAANRANWLPLALIAGGVGWLIARNTGNVRPVAREGAAHTGDQPTGGPAEADGNVRPAGPLRQSFERHPLLIGLAGIVAGGVISAMLPPSKREREWSDKARKELWNQAEEIGHNAAGRLRKLAEPPAVGSDLAADRAADHRAKRD